jgi:hypothetical protein
MDVRVIGVRAKEVAQMGRLMALVAGSMAQISFFVGYRRRKSLFYAFPWRRSRPQKLICAKEPGNLRQVSGKRYQTISEGISTREAVRVARSPRRASRVDQ